MNFYLLSSAELISIYFGMSYVLVNSLLTNPHAFSQSVLLTIINNVYFIIAGFY